MSTMPRPSSAARTHGTAAHQHTAGARPHGSPVVARTVALADPGPLLSLLPDLADPRLVSAWVRRGEGLVGWGRALEHTTHGADRFADAEAWWQEVVVSAVVRDEVRLPGTGPVAFGSVSYA